MDRFAKPLRARAAFGSDDDAAVSPLGEPRREGIADPLSVAQKEPGCRGARGLCLLAQILLLPRELVRRGGGDGGAHLIQELQARAEDLCDEPSLGVDANVSIEPASV